MKGLILAAGRGSRLLPLSATRPKHALPVAGVPIIARAVRALRAAGVSEIGVVCSPGCETDLRDATDGEGALTFIHQPEALGTGHALLCAQEFLGGQDTLLYLGDNLFEDALRPVVDALRGADAVLGVKRVPDPSAFGVVEVSGGLVRRLVEKPPRPQSDLAACGVFAFRADLLDLVADLPPSPRGEIEFPAALSQLIARGGTVRAVEFTGHWADAGTPEDLLAANTFFLDQLCGRVEGRVRGSELRGEIYVAPGACVQDSELIGPVWIGPHARVCGAVVGPHVSVGAHARVQGATVRESLIDDFARVLRPREALERALIGRHALVGRVEGERPALVVGDRSVVAR